MGLSSQSKDRSLTPLKAAAEGKRKEMTQLTTLVKSPRVSSLISLPSKAKTMNVLVLHGHGQNASIMQDHMRELAGKLSRRYGVVFTYMDAPFLMSTTNTLAHREWFPLPDEKKNDDDDDTSECDISHRAVERSIEAVQDFVHKAEKERAVVFDVMVGFGQGASMIQLLPCCSAKQRSIKIILIGARPLAGVDLSSSSSSSSSPLRHSTYYDNEESLHLMGMHDKTVSLMESMQLSRSYPRSSVFIHTGGHSIPSNDEATRHIAIFLGLRKQ